MLTDYVELYPRDWVPDLTRTGGDRPHIVIMIPRQTWIGAGRPESIEDWQKCAIVAPAYAALNDAALKQFIDVAVAKELERLRERCEALRGHLLGEFSEDDYDGIHVTCQVCGHEWDACNDEDHMSGCLAAPEAK